MEIAAKEIPRNEATLKKGALTRRVTQAVSIPVIASGGAGSYEHMAQALREANVSAVAAASIYHFTEQTPLEAKRYLAQQGFRTRL